MFDSLAFSVCFLRFPFIYHINIRLVQVSDLLSRVLRSQEVVFFAGILPRHKLLKREWCHILILL